MNTSASDNNSYNNVIELILKDDNSFQNFKQLPDYNIVLEHVSNSLGQDYLNVIKRDNPFLLGSVNEFKVNDIYGNPMTFKYDEIDMISPSTLRYIKVLSDLIKMKIDLTDKNIIEIGGGYGGQCLILSKYFKFKSYTIVDLNGPLRLSEKYLNLHEIKNVLFKEMNDLDNASTYDFMVSNYAFSECNKEVQNIYYDKIIKNSTAGYMTSNKNDIFVPIERFNIVDEDPISGLNNVILTWDMKTILQKYIIEQFGSKTEKEQRKSHYSYCLFPEEECSCKNLNEITYNTSLISGGYIDSFSMLIVLIFIEKTFNIKIPDIEARPHNFDTINNMVELINKIKK